MNASIMINADFKLFGTGDVGQIIIFMKQIYVGLLKEYKFITYKRTECRQWSV